MALALPARQVTAQKAQEAHPTLLATAQQFITRQDLNDNLQLLLAAAMLRFLALCRLSFRTSHSIRDSIRDASGTPGSCGVCGSLGSSLSPALQPLAQGAVLLVAGLELADPVLAFLLRLSLLLDLPELALAVALRAEVKTARDHGSDCEALRGDSGAEHALHPGMVASPHRPVGIAEGRDGKEAPDWYERLLLQSAEDLLEPGLVVEIPRRMMGSS